MTVACARVRVEVLDHPGNRRLHQTNGRRPGCERQQHEEYRREEHATRHLTKRQRQGLEHQSRTSRRIKAVRENERENRETGQNRDRGIRRTTAADAPVIEVSSGK